MKKDYVKPTMRVGKMQPRQHILTGSVLRGANGVSNEEDINWKKGGFEDTEGDY